MAQAPRETSGIRHSVARTLLVLAALLVAWGIAIGVTGGFYLNTGGIRISSRSPLRPLALGFLFAAAAWWLRYRDHPPPIPLAGVAWARRAATVAIVPAAAALLLIAGVSYGVRVASRSDGFAYVSQSALWVDGNLRIDQRAAASLPWPNAAVSFAPLGYRVADGDALVSTVAPGAPLLMAAGRLLSTAGPYLVGPICGALLVIFTLYLGRHLFSAGAAIVAALLVACSPIVVEMTLASMADMPAAACWTGAFAAAVSGRRSAGSLTAGVLTGLAVMIRPNLAPLAVFPWLMAVVRSRTIGEALRPTIWFAAGSVPFALVVGWFNNHLYGSPLATGYGELGPGFALGFAVKNLARYPAWWFDTQGPLGFVWVPAVFRSAPRRRERLVLAAFATCVGLSYLFYLPFPTWPFLRFGLPAIPIVFLFTADLVDWVFRGSPHLRLAGLAALLLLMGATATQFSRSHVLLRAGINEQLYVEAGLHCRDVTPPEAVILAVQHSGSIRYYSGRLTMRWDMLDGEWLDKAIAALRGRGVPVFLLLEKFEEPAFRERFRGQGALAELDRGASALGWNGELRFYPLGQDGAATARVPVTMTPVPFHGPIVDISPAFTRPAALSRLSHLP